MPKSGFVISKIGSLRLVWFKTLVKVPSARRCTLLVIANRLLRPADKFTVPGPTMSPTLSLPNRPIGSVLTPTPQALPATVYGGPLLVGQANAFGLSH